MRENKPHVGVYEAVAADLAHRQFLPNDVIIAHHVDNSGDCFALVRGTSACVLTHAIVRCCKKFICKGDYYDYWVWISTHSNPGDYCARMVKSKLLMEMSPNGQILPVTDAEAPWEVYAEAFNEYKAIGVRRKKRKNLDDLDGRPYEGPIPHAVDHDHFPTAKQLSRFVSAKERRSGFLRWRLIRA